MSLKSKKGLIVVSRVEGSYYTIIRGSIIQAGGDDVIVIFGINGRECSGDVYNTIETKINKYFKLVRSQI
jgi:hypothetical protein